MKYFVLLTGLILACYLLGFIKKSEKYQWMDRNYTTAIKGFSILTVVWGPTAMLPVFEILGTNYKLKRIVTHYIDKERNFDDFTKMDFTYDNAVASIKVGMGVKSEGELIVSGTKGYIYVPAPWWKTDYFELRYENAADNRRYFYQLDGEGIRYELVAFVRAIDNGRMARYIEEYVSEAISSIVSDFHNGIDVIAIKN